MVCPILISVSLTPGPYCFWASAGCADNAASARPSSPSFLTNIDFLQAFCCDRVFCCHGSVSERRGIGKLWRADHISSHPSEHEALHIRNRWFALLGNRGVYGRSRCPRCLTTIN